MIPISDPITRPKHTIPTSDPTTTCPTGKRERKAAEIRFSFLIQLQALGFRKEQKREGRYMIPISDAGKRPAAKPTTDPTVYE